MQILGIAHHHKERNCLIKINWKIQQRILYIRKLQFSEKNARANCQKGKLSKLFHDVLCIRIVLNYMHFHILLFLLDFLFL